MIGNILAEEDPHMTELDNETATIAITAHWKNSPTRIAASYTFAQTFALENAATTIKIDAKERVPTKYHKYLHLFSKAASNRLPRHKSYDHAINLIKDAKMT